MASTTASEAHTACHDLSSESAVAHASDPVTENACRAIAETQYLLAIPGLRASIIEGMATPVAACSNEMDWQPEDAPPGSE
jgi:hypothetical protein